MSTGTWTSVGSTSQARTVTWSGPYALLKALGSLKITVVLFTLGIFIVLFGTLAQDEETLVQVKRQYFNSWLAWIPLDVFVPQTIHEHKPLTGGFPFPGGAAIGLALMINLIAAKTTRFSIHATGARLTSGLVVSLLGAGLVTAVIMSGHASEGLQGRPPISYDQLWSLLRIGLVILTVAAGVYAFVASHLPALVRWCLWGGVAILAALTAIVLLGGQSARMDDPGLRIVWQLLQATIASYVVLAGLNLLFGKRGGNMLIHVGVALLMVGQFVFGDRQVEQRMTLIEGEQTNMAYRMEETEIAFIDTSNPEEDRVQAIPYALIRRALRRDGVIDDPQLPCIVRIDRWMANSNLKPIKPGSANLATVGLGLEYEAVETQTSGGASSSVNLVSAYVTLLDRQSRQPIGSVLLTQYRNDAQQIFNGGVDEHERLSIGGVPFELSLRFRRDYKDYYVHLKDVVRENYSGSETARDYSSLIHIKNPRTGEEITEKTWMNNPIRFGGETFYQSEYNPQMFRDGRMGEGTGLQVVRNAGWMIPYVCCMMVMIGMLHHFSGTFLRFAGRAAREQNVLAGQEYRSLGAWLAIGLGVLIAALAGGYSLRQPTSGVSDIDWTAVARLPVQHEGRIKPADTVAANLLQTLSEPIFGGSSYIKDADGNRRHRVEWLMAMLVDLPWTRDAQIIRVYTKEVRDLLKLEERASYRYSYNEINANREEFFKQIDVLREKSKKQEPLNFREQKISEMYQKFTTYELLTAAYETPSLPKIDNANDPEGVRRVMAELDQLNQRYRIVQSMHPPAFLPPADGPAVTGPSLESAPNQPASPESAWSAFGPARFQSILDMVRGKPTTPVVEAFEQVLAAMHAQKPQEINSAVRKYQQTIANTVAGSHLAKASAESRLNQVNPTALGIGLYLLALVLTFVSFGYPKYNIRHVSFGLLLGVFVIHTLMLVARMYISGRAPITNLYSTAIFIGWACVLVCLVLELIYRIGVANIVAALIGVITLAIARSLDRGDTLHVLMAVLDTQFWLSTHVVAINAGYAATFLGGFFGAAALVHMMVRHRQELSVSQQSQSAQFQQQMYRMGYFSICFGILFSFVGTVLGGLWADDSWGRFWGWDPKENGALMIVMWNAVVLHARWDKLVGLRGFSILALLGNIVTAWSWFGTNLLGIGLHTYGFNKSVVYALIVTVTVHLLLILVALLVTRSTSPRVSGE
ncbi:MAG: cytochrome c biogenesis protein CcsA [Pirellulaceae bacterium]|nr:cytochrome c biogenesis protein CcsA [Pirellulaceae bacterium]